MWLHDWQSGPSGLTWSCCTCTSFTSGQFISGYKPRSWWFPVWFRVMFLERQPAPNKMACFLRFPGEELLRYWCNQRFLLATTRELILWWCLICGIASLLRLQWLCMCVLVIENISFSFCFLEIGGDSFFDAWCCFFVSSLAGPWLLPKIILFCINVLSFTVASQIAIVRHLECFCLPGEWQGINILSR